MILLKVLNRIPSLVEPCGVVGCFSTVVDDICGNGNLFFPRQYTVLDLLLLRISDPQRETKNTHNGYTQGKLFLKFSMEEGGLEKHILVHSSFTFIENND